MIWVRWLLDTERNAGKHRSSGGSDKAPGGEGYFHGLGSRHLNRRETQYPAVHDIPRLVCLGQAGSLIGSSLDVVFLARRGARVKVA